MTTEKHQSHHADATTATTDAETAKATASVEAAKPVKKEAEEYPAGTDGGGDQGNPNPH